MTNPHDPTNPSPDEGEETRIFPPSHPGDEEATQAYQSQPGWTSHPASPATGYPEQSTGSDPLSTTPYSVDSESEDGEAIRRYQNWAAQQSLEPRSPESLALYLRSMAGEYRHRQILQDWVAGLVEVEESPGNRANLYIGGGIAAAVILLLVALGLMLSGGDDQEDTRSATMATSTTFEVGTSTPEHTQGGVHPPHQVENTRPAETPPPRETTTTTTITERPPQMVGVPNVTGESVADARSSLAGAGFQVNPNVVDQAGNRLPISSASDYTVTQTNPAPGSRVSADDRPTVTLTVAVPKPSTSSSSTPTTTTTPEEEENSEN